MTPIALLVCTFQPVLMLSKGLFRGCSVALGLSELQAHQSKRKADGLSGLVGLGLEI